MLNLFGSLRLAQRALLAQRAALHTTGHNIANANTDGYSRQRIELRATALQAPTGSGAEGLASLGTGVEVAGLSRLRDRFLDGRVREEIARVGEWGERERILGQIEVIFDEPSDNSLQSVLNLFWEAWQALSNNPSSRAAREIVLQRSETLVAAFQSLDSQLEALAKNLDGAIVAGVAAVNDLAGQIADVNGLIRASATSAPRPADLEDQRDRLVEELAEYVDVDVSLQDDGTYRLTVGGVTLVDGERVHPLRTSSATPGGPVQVEWAEIGQAAAVGSGRLRALSDLRSVTIPGYRDDLRTLAWSIADAVNGQHQAGYDANDNPGAPLFENTATPGSFALVDFDFDTFAVALSDPDAIAAATQAGSPGDAGNAQRIADLRLTGLSGLSGATAEDAYQGLIGELGIEAQAARRQEENASALLEKVRAQRESVSGVSLDEEMTEMIRFQHAYNAAARLVTTLDEMLGTVIERMGVTGR